MAMLGVPAHVIKVLGRWQSLSYQLYIRTSNADLKAYMAQLAASLERRIPVFGGLSLDAASVISDDLLDSLPRVAFSSR